MLGGRCSHTYVVSVLILIEETLRLIEERGGSNTYRPCAQHYQD